MLNDNLQKLNNYFEKYIDRMFIKDIELLKARNDEFNFSYPYILLTCSCIDLFGGIEKDFAKLDGQGNSFERFTWFVIEWMGKVNSLYKEKDLAYLIYDRLRNGIIHQATFKKGFETSSSMYPRDKHLHFIKDNERIFIHSLQFADDLIEAQKMYRKYINKNESNVIYINSLYTHLLNMIDENNPKNKQNFDQFILLLQRNHLVFNSYDKASTTTTFTNSTSIISSKSQSQKNIARLPDENLSSVIPSAAAREDDLK